MIHESAVIHATAIIHEGARIGANVEIGPWSLIGADVEIGDECSIASHVVIKGPTKIGNRNRIFQFCSIGEDCQDKKYKGERTFLEIGDDNVSASLMKHFRRRIADARCTARDQNGLTRKIHPKSPS